MKKYILPMLVVLSLVGLLDALYLSYEHFQNVIPPCAVGSFSDCGKVLQSSYSVVLGIPLAVIGVAQYATVFALTILTSGKKKWAPYILVLQSKIGFLGSLYFVYLQLVVLHAICLYCMVSAAISTLIFLLVVNAFSSERKEIFAAFFGFIYTRIVKKIFFLFDAEKVHVLLVTFGEKLGSNFLSHFFVKVLLKGEHRTLKQTIEGITFQTPIGLAAGFDYEARLTQTLAPWGFGFQTVGTITNKPYEGNPSPMLGRLPKSRSLMVNKGYKNDGARVTVKRLQGLSFEIPVGVSIGKTNTKERMTQAQSIADIVSAFTVFETSKVKHSYYELNISCPNLYGNVTFYPPEKLHQLLTSVDRLKLSRPVFIKMPIDKSDQEVRGMLAVILKHNIAGVIFGNLQKDRTHTSFNQDEIKQFPVGNFSGKPTYDRSNELISLAYRVGKKKLTIIGCGGVFSGEDAYEKIKRGASVVQLITGMIFEGPQLISQINVYLEKQLIADGFTTISQAIGSAHRKEKTQAKRKKKR